MSFFPWNDLLANCIILQLPQTASELLKIWLLSLNCSEQVSCCTTLLSLKFPCSDTDNVTPWTLQWFIGNGLYVAVCRR